MTVSTTEGYNNLPLTSAEIIRNLEENYDMAPEVKPEGRAFDTPAQYLALGGAGLCALTTCAMMLSGPTSGWFTLHPPLQTIALFLITYGVLTLQPTSQPATKAAGLERHQIVIAGLAAPTILLGTFSVWYHKTLNGAPHFTTWHGFFGLITIVWAVVQVLIGGLSVWFGGAAFGGGAKAKAIYKYHRLSGYMLFPILLFTVYLGGSWSSWAAKHSSESTRFYVYTLGLPILGAAAVSRIRTSKLPL